MLNRRSAFRIATIILIAALTVSLGCKKKPEPATDSRPALGTNVTIEVYDPGMTKEKLKPLFDEVYGLFSEWEKKVILPGSINQIQKIADDAGVRSIGSDPTVFDMLMKAIRLYDASGKTFDIRYGPMLDAWGFGKQPRVPSDTELDSLKQFVEGGGMFVAGNSVLLAKKGMRFDVREIAIGQAFDLAAAKLAEQGIRSAMISCPRVSRTIGDPPDKRGFAMSLASPLDGQKPWGKLYVPVGGVAFASAAVDRFTQGGKNYHSLLDPRNGKPANQCTGAVVQAPDAATAQALAYGLFVLGTTDQFDNQGKAQVGGTLIARDQGGRINAVTAGSLADRFVPAK